MRSGTQLSVLEGVRPKPPRAIVPHVVEIAVSAPPEYVNGWITVRLVPAENGLGVRCHGVVVGRQRLWPRPSGASDIGHVPQSVVGAPPEDVDVAAARGDRMRRRV